MNPSILSIWRYWFAIGVIAACLVLTACENEQFNLPGTLSADESVSVVDFSGEQISLSRPARRIVALAPHLVENVYSAGAGEYLVGVVKHSDFPKAARELPIVGGYQSASEEAILLLEPDLVLAWESGNSYAIIRHLKELGLTVYVDQTDSLEDVAKTIRDIGTLARTSEKANRSSQVYLDSLSQLRAKYIDRPRIKTFYQVWNSPIRTISGNHIISDTIELCGGENIYAEEIAVSPTVSIESVLDRNPQAIIASGMADERPEWLDMWRKWGHLDAVKNEALYFVHPDHIQRHTTRLLLAAKTVCEQLDQLREELK
ncbi:MAG: cobalamin-binding protein [Pseudomonadota bacterium]